MPDRRPETEATIRSLRVHLGAHKTATTHLQKALHKHRDALRAADVDFIRPVELRAVLQSGEGRLRLPWRAERRLRDAVAGLRTGAGTLAISEENLPGLIRDQFEDPPYPRLGSRLAPLRRLAGDAPVALFLAVRSFDTLWPSAHAEALRHHAHDPGRIERLRRLARTRPPSWLEIVGRIRRACPQATIGVWQHEDHAAHWRAFAAAFIGRDTGLIPGVTRPKFSMSPSAEGVRRAEAVAGPVRRAAVAAIYAAHPASSGPRFAPFDAAEIEALRGRYAADLAGLRAEGLLLEPDRDG